MSVLVSGSAGLVGHAVRMRLEAAGTEVVPVDRVALSTDGIAQVACDVTDGAELERVATAHGVTAVVHCGGVSGPMVGLDDPRGIVEVNVGGTANLLDLARRHRMRRFVYCSSIAAYGMTPPEPVSESAPLRPLDVYGATKAAGEHLVTAYSEQHGVPGVSLRISTVFGPRRRTDCLVRTLLSDAASGRATAIELPEDAPQQFVHVDDVAAAAVAALGAAGTTGAFNVTGGTVLTVRDVVESVRRADPRVRATMMAPDPIGAARWPARLDIAAAERDLGWTPEQDFETAVRGYRAWLERERSA